ncbi:DNA primase [Evansella halocellulosilytica]|uniref:DNA primase n=1 Tax=Evansella halocellulosilytica TaxID=2011013 RepID=UPI000BB88AA3|nr:DNA primase [Evansella halocellulosilytica]
MKKKALLTGLSTVLALGLLSACGDEDVDVDDGTNGTDDGEFETDDNGDDADLGEDTEGEDDGFDVDEGEEDDGFDDVEDEEDDEFGE